MSSYDQYARPYCPVCKLIWGKQSTGVVFNCNKCGNPLTLKSFNPWRHCVKGIGIFILASLTLILSVMPIIWIGGFIWGFQIIIHAFSEWSKIKRLDQPEDSTVQPMSNSSHEVISCSNCSQKFRIPKGRGIIKVRCPICKREYRVMT